MPTQSNRIIATFHPQAWIDGLAIEVEPLGDTQWDATSDVMNNELGHVIHLRDDTFDSDALSWGKCAPDWVRAWSGPFFVEVEDSIRDFFEEEYGVEHEPNAFPAACCKARLLNGSKGAEGVNGMESEGRLA